MLWDGIHAISLECRIDQPVVQTGQSRLHNVNDLAEQARAWVTRAHVLKLIVSVEVFAAIMLGLVEPIGIEPMTSSLQS